MIAQSRPTVLLTRPAAAAERFARALQARYGPDLAVVVSPLLAPRFLDPGPQDRAALAAAAGLVFTSETGVAGYARISADATRPAWCVGPRTAEAARAIGLRAAVSGGDAGALLADLVALRPAGPLVLLRGVHAAGDLGARLQAAGLDLREIVLYEQAAQPLSARAQALLVGAKQASVLAPVFSPRSAALLARALPGDGARACLLVAAISEAAAAPLRPAARALAVAPTPDHDGMMTAVERLIATPPSP